MAATKTHSAPALERALSILELLARSRNGLTLAELTHHLALPKSSTHCLLVTLERCGYLQRNQKTSRYMFGLKLLTLASLAVTRIELREQARPFLEALVDGTQLTAHLAVLDRNEAVLIEKVAPLGLLRVATWIGRRMDAHCTGVGKALIAHLPEEELDRLLRENGLPRHNNKTIASFKRLKEELAQVRRLGYSLDDEEDEVGFRCIGAPVFDHSGAAVAAISVAGNIVQIRQDNLPRLASKVIQTASAISRELGYLQPAVARAGT